MGEGMSDPLETVLSRLDRWRHLPKYRLEQHVDVLFGLTLPTVIRAVFKTEGELHVIPEFPIRHGTVCTGRGNNQSFNIDFAVFAEGGKQVLLVELKTDAASIDPTQLSNMRKIPGRFDAVVDAIGRIAKNSKEKRKYLHLISELHNAAVLSAGSELELPNPTAKELSGFANALKHISCADTVTRTPKLVLVHPGPASPGSARVDVSGFCCIDFAQYAAEMRQEIRIEALFARYLCKWRTPAGRVMLKWQDNASPSPDS